MTNTPKLRCPICYSPAVSEQPSSENERHCHLCGFTSFNDEDFKNWKDYTKEPLLESNQLITSNPNSWFRKLFRLKPSDTQKTMLNPRTIEAVIEKNGRAVIDQYSIGLFGLPVKVGRWGEKIVTQSRITENHRQNTHGVLTVGAICTLNSVSDMIEIIKTTTAITQHYIFVVDTVDHTAAEKFAAKLTAATNSKEIEANIQVLENPLNNDFGAQRSIIQQNACTEWIIQIDNDERFSTDMIQHMATIIEKAENCQYNSIGFPRRNLVNGMLTAHYPDIQYRLNRRGVQFHKPVHETPHLPWHQQGISWLGYIEHSLESKRLKLRSKKYEKIADGAGKPIVLQLLQEPFYLP